MGTLVGFIVADALIHRPRRQYSDSFSRQLVVWYVWCHNKLKIQDDWYLLYQRKV